jgi:hypothetical protein
VDNIDGGCSRLSGRDGLQAIEDSSSNHERVATFNKDLIQSRVALYGQNLFFLKKALSSTDITQVQNFVICMNTE